MPPRKYVHINEDYDDGSPEAEQLLARALAGVQYPILKTGYYI
jgi:hypothetical protein